MFASLPKPNIISSFYISFLLRIYGCLSGQVNFPLHCFGPCLQVANSLNEKVINFSIEARFMLLILASNVII